MLLLIPLSKARSHDGFYKQQRLGKMSAILILNLQVALPAMLRMLQTCASVRNVYRTQAMPGNVHSCRPSSHAVSSPDLSDTDMVAVERLQQMMMSLAWSKRSTRNGQCRSSAPAHGWQSDRRERTTDLQARREKTQPLRWAVGHSRVLRPVMQTPAVRSSVGDFQLVDSSFSWPPS